MTSSEISIITPVYNGERYLSEVVKSVLSQQDIAIRMIIINDGSTDSSLRIAQEWCKRFPKQIEIIDQPNSGEAVAVINGMAKVQTKFVGIVNADDPLLPGHCRKMVEALLLDPKAVVAYPDWLMTDSDGAIQRNVKTLEYSRRALIADLVCIPGPGAVIRVEALDGFPIREKQFRYISDYVLWLRLSSKGHFIRVPETLATWRQHLAGTTTSGKSGAITSEIKYLVENDFLGYCETVIESKWVRSARAHVYYYAALDALISRQVPGRRLLLKSLLIKPYPNLGYPTHHRSLLASIAIFIGPLGRFAYKLRNLTIGLVSS
jgi:glycosyltransferase involved in cell wall biosynthesis